MNMFGTTWQIVGFQFTEINCKSYIYFIEVVDSITDSSEGFLGFLPVLHYWV